VAELIRTVVKVLDLERSLSVDAIDCHLCDTARARLHRSQVVMMVVLNGRYAIEGAAKSIAFGKLTSEHRGIATGALAP
jgi:hypothetical protein